MFAINVLYATSVMYLVNSSNTSDGIGYSYLMVHLSNLNTTHLC